MSTYYRILHIKINGQLIPAKVTNNPQKQNAPMGHFVFVEVTIT
jgi:hypothetical protein